MVRVKPYRPSAENISEMVLCTLDMFNCIVINLKICLDIKHPSILNLCDVLELEVLKATAVRKYLNHIVTMCSVKVALPETVLDCQEL